MSDITEDDAKALREQGDLSRFIKDQNRAAATRNAHRRAAVLAFPDIAAKLTQPPMKFSSPEMWTGFIPPATTDTGAINPSPVRPALLALLTEVEQRRASPARRGAA